MGSDVTSKVKAPHALTRTESLGRIEVSPRVVASVVGHAANECYGVVGMAARGLRDGIAERLNRDVKNDTLCNSSQQKSDIARIKLAQVLGGVCRRALQPGREQPPSRPPCEITREAAGRPDPFATPPHQRRNSQTITTPAEAARSPDARRICGGTSIARAATRFIPSGNNA